MSARWIRRVPPPGASTASVSVASSAGLSSIRRERLRHPCSRHGLHQVVERAQLERLHRRRLVGGDEDQRGRARRSAAARAPARCRRGRACARRGRRRRSARRASACSASSPDSAVSTSSPWVARAARGRGRPARAARRRRRARRGRRLRHAGRALRRGTSARASAPRSPLRGVDSTSRPYSGAERGLQPRVHVRQPDARSRDPCSAAPASSAVMPAPPSRTVSSTSASRSTPRISTRHGPTAYSTPCRTAFSTSGCIDSTGTTAVSTSGATFTRTCSRSPNRACSSRRYFST